MQPVENPYASPSSPPDSKSQLANRMKWLRGAAIGILLMATLEVFFGAFSVLALLLAAYFPIVPRRMTEGPTWLFNTRLIFSIGTVIRGVIMILGARQMRKMTSYRWSLAGAIVAMAGVPFPPFYLDFVFGLWALLLLLRKDTREAFAEAE